MKYQKSVHQAAVMITQFGINMLVPIFLCTFLGIWLDEKLGTNWIMVVLFFVGALAGGRNVFVFAKRIYTMEGDVRNRDRTGGRSEGIEEITGDMKNGTDADDDNDNDNNDRSTIEDDGDDGI